MSASDITKNPFVKLLKEPISTMKKWLYKTFYIILPPVVAFILGQWANQSTSATRSIEYSIKEQQPVLRVPDQLKTGFQITYNGKAHSESSLTYIVLANRTGSEASDITIYASFDKATNEDGQLLFASELVPEHFPPGNLKHLDDIDQKEKRVVSWNIKRFKSSYNNADWPAFVLIFSGKTSPKVKVTIDGAGVELTDFDTNKLSPNQKAATWISAIGLILIYAIIISILIFFDTRKERRKEGNRYKDVTQTLIQNFKISETDADKLYRELWPLFFPKKNEKYMHSLPSKI